MNSRLAVMQKITKFKDINRIMLAKEMDLSCAAITKIVNPMIDKGLIREDSYYSELRNRKARYLTVTPDRYCVVVLRIIRKGIIKALADISGKVVCQELEEMPQESIGLAAIDKAVSELLGRLGGRTCLCCVIIGPSGSLSPRKQDELCRPAWDKEAIVSHIASEYSLDVLCENDSNAALLAEIWFGAGQGYSSVVLYSVGVGIGASAYSYDILHRGFNNSALEIGHVTIKEDGPECRCGNRGCLEMYASTRVWEERYSGKDGGISFKDAFRLSAAGNEEASAIVSGYAQLLATGAVTLSTLLVPEVLVLTENEADYLDLPLLCSFMEENLPPRLYNLTDASKLRIVPSVLGQDGFILGSVPLALERYLR